MQFPALARRNVKWGWTDQENDLIVADYFVMLADDVCGRPYNKAEHRRGLLPTMAAWSMIRTDLTPFSGNDMPAVHGTLENACLEEVGACPRDAALQ